LSYYDIAHQTRQVIKAPFTTQDKFSWLSKFLRLNDSVFAISNGKTGGYYLGHYNQQTGKYILQPKLYCKNYLCLSLLIDKNNELWIRSSKGLLHEKRQATNIEKVTVPQSMNPLNNDINITTMTLAKNKLFVGTLEDGLLIFDRDSLNAIRKMDFREYGQTTDNVYKVFAINDDTMISGN
jgi:ligand-binding sensor domain-containing protein